MLKNKVNNKIPGYFNPPPLGPINSFFTLI